MALEDEKLVAMTWNRRVDKYLFPKDLAPLLSTSRESRAEVMRMMDVYKPILDGDHLQVMSNIRPDRDTLLIHSVSCKSNFPITQSARKEGRNQI
jgi:hypothetical protein